MVSSYWLCLIAVPIIAWVCYAYKRWSAELVWWELLLIALSGLLVAGITLFAGSKSKGTDHETWSGFAYTSWYQPQWVSEESITTTDSKGNQSTTYYDQTHEEEAWLETSLGRIDIPVHRYRYMANEHGTSGKALGSRPNYDRGDRYNYYVTLPTQGNLPRYAVHQVHSWYNPTKANDTVLKLPPLKAGDEAGLPAYPEGGDPLLSGRCLTGAVDPYAWDRLNAVVGPMKHVNLILVRLPSMDRAYKLQAYWRNGRKNDLVLCYGDGWSYVFGWSDTSLVKKDLESVLLDGVDGTLPDKVQEIVRGRFSPYRWTTLSYLKPTVPGWSVVLAVFLSALSCFIATLFATSNQQRPGGYRRFRY